MHRLVIAVWQVNTKSQRVPVANRIAELTTRLKSAWIKMQEYGKKDEPERVSHVFVAPEYLFTGLESHFMPEAEKENVLISLQALSRHYPEVLLIPGSAGWFKTAVIAPATLERKRQKQLNGANASASVSAAALASATNSMPSQAGASSSSHSWLSQPAGARSMAKYITKIDRFSAALKEFPGHFAEVATEMAPSLRKYFDEGYAEAIYNQNDALDYDAKGTAPSMRSLMLKDSPEVRIARNTCFVFSSGDLLHKYHKVFEAIGDLGYDRDIVQADRVNPILLLPGESAPTFQYGHLTYGLEICADHNSAALKINTQKIKLTDVDIHIVMSASTELDDIALVGKHLVIQADATLTLLRTKANGTPIEPKSTEKDVSIFTVDLEHSL